jgi:SAM-dependent methyltransferase
VYHCKRCKTWFADPDPWDYSDWREPDTDAVEYYRRFEAGARLRAAQTLAYVTERYGLAGRLLDVGCAAGHTLAAANDLGWTTTGLEPNRTLADHARSTLGLNVIHDSLRPGLFAPESFDVIILDQVLEHLVDVRGHFAEIVVLLRPGGILWIGIPPVDWLRVLLARLPGIDRMGERLNMYGDVEQHVNYFTRASIGRLVESHPPMTLLPPYHHHRWSIGVHRVLGLSTGNFLMRKR